MSITPLALSLALLLFWTGVGWTLIALVDRRIEELGSFLLSPICGIAATLLPIFYLNVLGLPVARSARPLAVLLFGIVLWVWLVRRPPWRPSYWGLALLVVAAMVLIGFPTFRYGFDWIANANDDWANYNLSALRHLNSGYYQRPSLDAMRAGLDYSGYFWLLDAALDSRSGSDLLLAWVAGLIGVNPFFVFMPLVLAFHGALSLAAGAVAYKAIGRGPALWAGVVLSALAPLGLYAVHQQLIAQVLGLAFMCGLTGLTFVPLRTLTTSRRMALVSIITAAYAIAYPETIPFFGLAFVVFHAAHIRDADWGWSTSWRLIGIVIGLVLLLGPYLIGFTNFLLGQVVQGNGADAYNNGVSLFPYFLVPSGLAVLFGLTVLAGSQSSLSLSLEIAFAIALGCLTFATMIMMLRLRNALGCYLLITLFASALLIKSHNDFGLFKLAMYIQPLLWFGLVAGLSRTLKRWAALPIMLLGCATLATNVQYTSSALDETVGGANPLAGASRAHLLTKLINDRAVACQTDLGTVLPSLAKILSANPGCAHIFESRAMPMYSIPKDTAKRAEHNFLHRFDGIGEFTREAEADAGRLPIRLEFPLPNGGTLLVMTSQSEVEYDNHVHAPSFDGVIDSNGLQADLNIYTLAPDAVTFLNSDLGVDYYRPDSRKAISLYGQERDPFSPRGVMAAVGRYLLFRLHAPTQTVRLQLDLTMTFLGSGPRSLPPAAVLGETAAPLGLVGHGSGRVISAPLKPLVVNGVAYLMLDLGADPLFLKTQRVGLMKLYGNDVVLDYRNFVGFARDIRVRDGASRSSADAPSEVSDLPKDLYSQALQYSGLYEDGWMGDEGFFLLHSSRPGVIVFRAQLPAGIGLDTVDLDVGVDGSAPIHKSLRPGDFVVQIPVAAGSRRVEFHYSKLGRLSAGDDRPVSAKFSSIAIEADSERSAPLEPDPKSPEVLRNVGRHSDGVFQDGWLAPRGFFQVQVVRDGDVVLKGLVPGGLGLEEQHIQLMDGADAVLDRDLVPGAFEIVVPVKAGVTNLAFSFSNSASLPTSDGRRIGALLNAVSLGTQHRDALDPDLHQ